MFDNMDDLYDAIQEAEKDIAEWGTRCDSCGWGPGYVRDLLEEIIRLRNRDLAPF